MFVSLLGGYLGEMKPKSPSGPPLRRKKNQGDCEVGKKRGGGVAKKRNEHPIQNRR